MGGANRIESDLVSQTQIKWRSEKRETSESLTSQTWDSSIEWFIFFLRGREQDFPIRLNSRIISCQEFKRKEQLK